MDAVSQTGQWVILYIDGKPCILAGGPAGATHERVLEQFRTAMLGNLPEGTVLDAKDLYEAPIDDVLRVGVIAIMQAMTAMHQTIAELVNATKATRVLRH